MAHILIVDDEPDIRDLLARFMERFGHTSDQACDGLEGIERVEATEYDLILSDVRMPVLDGIGFLKRIQDRVASRTPCMIVTAFDDVKLAIEATRLGVCNFLVKPFDGNDLKMAVERALDLRAGWAFHRRHEEKLQDELRGVIQVFLTEFVKRLDATGEAGDHCRRVAEWAVAVAREMGIEDKRKLLDIRMGALLHDVGKVRIKPGILLKDGPLDDEEWAEIRRHPEFGAEIIRGIPRLEGALPIIEGHHEKFDGRGYPRGLRGDDIPLEARIFSVVDAFDCMLEARPYQAEISPDRALEELRRCSGTQFDPDAVAAFERVYPRYVEQHRRHGGHVPSNGQICVDLGSISEGTAVKLAQQIREETHLEVQGNGNGNGQARTRRSKVAAG